MQAHIINASFINFTTNCSCWGGDQRIYAAFSFSLLPLLYFWHVHTCIKPSTNLPKVLNEVQLNKIVPKYTQNITLVQNITLAIAVKCLLVLDDSLVWNTNTSLLSINRMLCAPKHREFSLADIEILMCDSVWFSFLSIFNSKQHKKQKWPIVLIAFIFCGINFVKSEMWRRGESCAITHLWDDSSPKYSLDNTFDETEKNNVSLKSNNIWLCFCFKSVSYTHLTLPTIYSV